MDTDKLEGDETIKNPNLEIAQLRFALTLPEYFKDESIKSELYEAIVADDMAPYYEIVCEDLWWNVDQKLMKEMKERNGKALEEFDKEIEYASNNLSLIEVKEAYLHKANYLSKIGDKDNTIKTLSQAFERTVALGYKLDNVFHCIRTGLFFMDLDLVERNLQRSKSLIAEGADWHSRNCYKICKALYSLATRDFSTATKLLVDAISTFVCTEFIPYDTFIKYTVLSAVLTLSRSELKKNLLDNPDMQQALHSNDTLKEYLFSLYDCEYKVFFLRLADMEVIMKRDMFLNPHYKFYVKEMKIKAYDQLLSTYLTVNISYMADQFGVSTDYIDNEVSKLIAAGRLNYKIDKVKETIVNVRKNGKMDVFKAVVKHGDLLLNRIQKLSRVINI